MADWQDESKQIEEARKFAQSIKIESGTTVDLEATSNEISTLPSRFNNRMQKIIPVKYNGEERSFWLAENNPTYRDLIALAKKNGALKGLKFSVTKTGTGLQTRYALKQLK
jgi:hypothetical protein